MSLLRDIAYAAGAAVTAPYWGWRMLRTGKWRTDWAGRLGRVGAARDERSTLLIHAVSVGEVNAIRRLVAMLEERHGDRLRLVISVTTDTGTARARALFEPRHTVVRYPLDFTCCVRRFLGAVRPDAVALVELEVWPTFIEQCARRGIPVAVINGRLSERSYRRYRKIRPFIRGSFAKLHTAAVQDEVYARRFIEMGVPADRVKVLGTMKWDTAVLCDSDAGDQAMARAMGIETDRPLVVCGSTELNEEQMIIDALRGLDVQILIAPRKPEHFEEAAAVMGDPVRRTKHPDGQQRPVDGRPMFLLDTIGELRRAYALASVVIVGRSFCPLYGSDMIEPIGLGKPTIIGPHTANFADVMEKFLAADGILQLRNIGELRGAVTDLLDPARAAALAERGRSVIRQNQGATQRHVHLIESLLTVPTTLDPRDLASRC